MSTKALIVSIKIKKKWFEVNMTEDLSMITNLCQKHSGISTYKINSFLDDGAHISNKFSSLEITGYWVCIILITNN